jgi:hypothetical protein
MAAALPVIQGVGALVGGGASIAQATKGAPTQMTPFNPQVAQAPNPQQIQLMPGSNQQQPDLLAMLQQISQQGRQ